MGVLESMLMFGKQGGLWCWVVVMFGIDYLCRRVEISPASLFFYVSASRYFT